MKKITTKTEFQNAAQTVFELMNKGEGNLSAKELATVKKLSKEIQEYERELYPIQLPKTLAGMVELKLYERRLNQEKLAKKLKMSPAKFSMIIRGKQKPDVAFLKGIRKELGISADFILDHV
jgi:HTH-type transcriptional regulator / antitoxin HigA